MNYSTTTINKCSKISINGKIYENIKGTMEITDKGIFVNGQPIEEYKEPTVVYLIIEGDVECITSDCGDITVHGSAKTINSKNGNVIIKSTVEGNVESKNGNITITGGVNGDVTSKNGNIMYNSLI